MARIGILTLYATGHVTPSLVLARALLQHGHQVIFFNLPDTEATATAAGVPFVVYGEAEYPSGSLLNVMQKTAELSGAAAFAHYVQRMVLLFQAGFRDLPERLRAAGLDLLIVDQVHYAGATIAEHVGVPFVSLANALLVNREDGIPPPIMLWPYSTAPEAMERNRKGWAGVDQAYGHLLPVVNRQREAWGLTPYTNLLENSFSPLLQLAQQPPTFDFPRPQAPATLHLIGPLRDETRHEQEVPFEWDWLDGRPLLYASCGTLQNRLEHVYRAIIEACAPLEAQTVIALGKGGFTPEFFGNVPPNLKLVPFAPQRALLQRATACITHAGLNTTLDCLELGVPMIAVPIASEQPGIAMRIAHLGAGLVVPLDGLRGAALGDAVQRVLSEPGFRAAAARAREQIEELRPAEEGVHLIEQALTIGSKGTAVDVHP